MRTSRLSISIAMAAVEPRGLRWFLGALAGRLSNYRAQCALVAAALMVDVAFETAIPLSLKFLIDDAIVPRRGAMLATILTALAIGAVIVACVQMGRDYLYASLGSRVLADLRRELYAKLQTLSLAYFAATPVGEITTRFSNDLASVENVVVLALPASLMAALSVVVGLVVLIVLEWRLAIVGAFGVALCAIGPRLLSRRAEDGSRELKARQSVLATMIQQDLSAQPVIKAFGLRSVLEPLFHTAVEKLRKTGVRANFAAYLMERTPNIGLMFFNVLVIAAGSYLAFHGRLSIGSLVTFQALLMNLSMSVYGMTSVMPHFVQGAAGMQRIEELLGETSTITDAKDATALPRIERAIRFDNVSFGYRYGELSLRSLNFDVPAGAITALVGASGSGKSTALNLLPRFYDPTAGAIRFDGRDVRTVTQDSLRAQVGVVFQESFVFNTTVRENIRYGRLDASDAEVEAAAKLAEVHDVIASWPAGYDTVAGARGSNLSGGQRQRVAIARALLRDPAVLLLDEATSALDPAAEASINATIERLRGRRTIVMVTHRLSSVRSVDQIVVFANGHVAQIGTHKQLVAVDGPYRALWEKQSGLSLLDGGDQAVVDVERLRSLPLFGELDTAMLTELSVYFGTEHYAAGRDVIQQGDYGDRFYIIVRGRLLVTKHDAAGAPVEVATLTDGDHFGEIALLRDDRRNATVKTLTPSVLLSLSRTHFVRLIERAPAMRARVEADLIARG